MQNVTFHQDSFSPIPQMQNNKYTHTHTHEIFVAVSHARAGLFVLFSLSCSVCFLVSLVWSCLFGFFLFPFFLLSSSSLSPSRFSGLSLRFARTSSWPPWTGQYGEIFIFLDFAFFFLSRHSATPLKLLRSHAMRRNEKQTSHTFFLQTRPGPERAKESKE